MDHFFDSPVLKTIFLGLAADFVTAPSEFPALGIPTLHIETAFDKRIPAYPNTESAQVAYCYFADGCQNLVDAVMGVITANGGRVITSAPVKRIVIEEGTVKGVELADGHFEPADRVLASGGHARGVLRSRRARAPARGADRAGGEEPPDGIGLHGAAGHRFRPRCLTNPPRSAITTRPPTWMIPCSACAPGITTRARRGC